SVSPSTDESPLPHPSPTRRASDLKKVILASYTEGSRERLEGLLTDHGVKPLIYADSWQEALGAGNKGVSLVVLGLDHGFSTADRSEEHTSELQSRENLVCRLLLEK